ncbi:MAG: hypothetical protein JOZ97_00690, partial [Candidatus Eremiobacteraeota bacterium]|nr:hypothetical protein [Candidatus Eremiobacteraeota bacterium]
MTAQLNEEQRAAADAPSDQLIVICGAAGSGKTTALRARAQRLNGTLLSAAHFSELPGLQTVALDVLARDSTSRPTLIDDIEASIIFERAAEPLLALEWAE